MRHVSTRWVLVVTAVALVGFVVTGQILGTGERTVEKVGLAAGIAVPFTVLGGLVLASKPRHVVGRLMVAAGLVAVVYLVALSWATLLPLAWLGRWLWWPSLGLVLLGLLFFPDGRLPSRRWRPVAAVVVAGTVAGTVLLAVAAVDHLRTGTTVGGQPAPWAGRVITVFVIVAAATLAGSLGILAALGIRWRGADSDTRRQLMCLLPAGLLFLLGLVFDIYGFGGGWAVAAGAVPVGMAVAILRYRLYDVDLIVNRTIVWLLMTTLVVLAVAGFVWILTDVVAALTQGRAALLATGLMVVAFHPLHARVQHGVDHLLYGDRDDPYLVLERLGEVLPGTVDPTRVMPLVTGTIARSLHVPYVAVELDERDGPALAAEHGRPVARTESFDMVSHGMRIGRLLVGRRSSGSAFTRHECRLLRDVALQAAVAAEATRMNRELQASRERLVATREEERRRLRRDLHDGLGPTLAGMSMQLRAAQRALPRDGRVADILAALAGDLQSCTAEVRRLVDALRPPALDRGLESALRAECDRFAAGPLSVRCEIDGELEGLPAAVDVVALRVVAEALTNVARHSHAGSCRVAVHRDGVLRVEIVDDGVGIAGFDESGVGLISMRERAAELGGTCTVGAAPDGGTAVSLALPLTAVQRAVSVPASPTTARNA
jgi:two-component system NarL family sensor kinase